MKRTISFICATALFAGAALAGAATPASINRAVQDPARPSADRQRDQDRKPAEAMDFAGVKPGLVVVDLIAGGGYFTRLLSVAVGSKGHVYTVAPPRPADAPPDMPDYSAGARTAAADPHYNNITLLSQSVKTLNLPVPVDMIWTAQNYHDLHNAPGMDLAAFNKSMFDALKPGGVFLVIDHTAEAGSGARDTASLHRIDPQLVEKEVTAAGFVLEAQSKALNRVDDRHTLAVFDPAVRGHTDQFMLKFRKPAK